ncbi:MAG: hypothetical protein UW81_C0041G0003 [Candidatus Giovannonibacteria bacterium GW2011_GWC2_44_9]|uniref:DUF3105 domain-containing protein n=3 Tax=Candidatus Giovannoniibacteriota TaxID=1752738 RepID=A0A1F5WBG6_9BACT|nr:MAG: hypothetical protein UW15_C0042G0006 [Parcubacteria group bacterium GW2011_GWC1_44_10]KKT59035.1 MAG: hypothetical protein UW53_C0024G0003 [Candidatus Giovannonibacteria bacterium GW2011_GWA1_44_25]KKT82456.1 MAG: hypothetical protein UW81_C0041G0003 [Candidatus Giovannonibacteria bacterium GW2011_GWC2_44_9]KKU29228.1 MAG: hypothetical protein UX43_C0014G0003 [Candidatus Giovannonibacteria bacterium GW2011_GWB1_46_20]OGF49897.1 MAG: hypothetical protein A2120_04380 [Candidatus Giovannon
MELTKKERRALRREEKKREITGGARQKQIKSWAIWSAAILIIGGAGYFGYRALSGTVKIPEMGEIYPIEGRDHVPDGTKVEYHTNPPSSGSHYAKEAEWGVYDKALSDGQLVHNLEHGGVWISYKPSIPTIATEKLISLAKSYRNKVILTPREANDKDIAVVSWGRIYKFDLAVDGSFDENAIKNYIKKYKNTGPEIVPD